MYMSREVMHCKPGKAKDLVTKFKKMGDAMKARGYANIRVYTDVSAEKYWTVVMEQDVEKIDDLAELSRKMSEDKELMKLIDGYHELVIDGRRELYKLE
jgi:hypothetical protein